VQGTFPEEAFFYRFFLQGSISRLCSCSDFNVLLICWSVIITASVCVFVSLSCFSCGDCAAPLCPCHWKAPELYSQHGESLHRLDLCRWTHHGGKLSGTVVQFTFIKQINVTAEHDKGNLNKSNVCVQDVYEFNCTIYFEYFYNWKWNVSTLFLSKEVCSFEERINKCHLLFRSPSLSCLSVAR